MSSVPASRSPRKPKNSALACAHRASSRARPPRGCAPGSASASAGEERSAPGRRASPRANSSDQHADHQQRRCRAGGSRTARRSWRARSRRRRCARSARRACARCGTTGPAAGSGRPGRRAARWWPSRRRSRPGRCAPDGQRPGVTSATPMNSQRGHGQRLRRAARQRRVDEVAHDLRVQQLERRC